MYIANDLIYTKINRIKDFKATVILTHGICEHTHRYDEIVETLNQEGYQTVQYDLRGHGRSGGKRGDIESFHRFVDDLHEIVGKVKSEFVDKPVILFGHSMGGLIIHLYAAKYTDVDALISSAAATDTPKSASALKHIGFWYLKWINLSSKSFADHLSRDESIKKMQTLDPYSIKKFKLNLVGQMFIKGVRFLKSNMSMMTKPILYLHGTDDKIVDYNFSEYMYKNVPAEDKTFKTYLNAKHELLNETNKKEVTKDIINWLNERFN